MKQTSDCINSLSISVNYIKYKLSEDLTALSDEPFF